MAEFTNFSFRNVNIIFGILEFSGFADGDDVVNIELETDQFTDLAGAKGDVVRAQTSDNRCTITVKLLQNAQTNKDLTAIYNIEKEFGTGGVHPMIVQDKETLETFSIAKAWIQKFPTVTRGQSPNSMDWVFRGNNFIPFLG